MRKLSNSKRKHVTVAPDPGAIAVGPRALLTKAQMLALLGDPAYSTVWGWMKDGYFPLAVELGPPNGRSTMIAWYADEIHAWIAKRPRRVLGKRLHEVRGRGRDADRVSLEQSKAEIVPKPEASKTASTNPKPAKRRTHDEAVA